MHPNYFMYTIPTNGNPSQVTTVSSPIINSNHHRSISHHPHAAAQVSNSHRSSNVAPNHTERTQPPAQSPTNYSSQSQTNAFVCRECGQSFTKESGLKRHHSRTHLKAGVSYAAPETDDSPFKCNACKVDYQNAPTFEFHIKTKHGSKNTHSQALKCIDCGCFRPITASSSNHEPFRCEACFRREQSASAQTYRIHSAANNSQSNHINHLKVPKLDMDELVQSMRNGESSGRKRKMHQCPDCNKCYKHQSTLAMHKKVHTGEYNFKCEYCDKEFYLAEYYNRHMRVHTKEKPYQCDVCDKAFSQSNTLIQHKRIHTGEKPYECTICAKSFSVKDYLMKHIRVHTGEKPFECEFCGKKYTQRSGLKAHQKSHFPGQNVATQA